MHVSIRARENGRLLGGIVDSAQAEVSIRARGNGRRHGRPHYGVPRGVSIRAPGNGRRVAYTLIEPYWGFNSRPWERATAYL